MDDLAKPENFWTLCFVLVRTLRRHIIRPFLSRLVVVIIHFVQLNLVGETIRFASDTQPELDTPRRGSRILATAILSCIGLAVKPPFILEYARGIIFANLNWIVPRSPSQFSSSTSHDCGW